MTHAVEALPIDTTLFAGIDVGGTKIGILDSRGETYHRYVTSAYPNMEAVLDDYFAQVGKPPAKVVLTMAGPWDEETGAITLTNGTWPAFMPAAAAQRYPGTAFETVNDMIGTAAGALAEEGVELKELKPGTPSRTGCKLVLAVSTGFGAAAAVWDKRTERRLFVASEGGHGGIQPENEAEAAYLQYLQPKYPRVSAEIALSGKTGIDHLIDHVLSIHYDTELIGAINRSRAAGQPVGAVLLEFAEAGEGTSRDVARIALEQLGGMIGSAMRNLALTFVASGGIYLTGSVSLALGEYLAEHTRMLTRFVHPGAVHESLVEKIPIYLVTDPHVAAKGALWLARQS